MDKEEEAILTTRVISINLFEEAIAGYDADVAQDKEVFGVGLVDELPSIGEIEIAGLALGRNGYFDVP